MKRSPALSFGSFLALGLVALAAARLPAQSVSRYAGSVTSVARVPLAGVQVFNTAGSVLTGANGEFSIDSTSVLHFQLAGYQPLTLLVGPAQSELHVQLQPSSPATSVTVPACAPPSRQEEHDARRVAPADSRFQFTVPRHGLRVTELGGVNLDEYVIEPSHSRAQLTLWFGPGALPLVPEDRYFLQSAAFSQRAVIAPGRPPGVDSSGTYPGGARWRHLSLVNAGATYSETDPRQAQLFDAVIGSLCAAPAP